MDRGVGGRSILDRDYSIPSPIYTEEDATPGYILVIVTILILVVGWGLLVYWAISSPRLNPKVVIDCPLGQCATNLVNGSKRCPEFPQTPVQVDPTIEVCNLPYACQNPLTPYALQADGSTNLDGRCPEGIQCRCLRNPQCADYITSTFVTASGNPYLPLAGQQVTFRQNLTSEGYNNPETTFCSVPIYWLNRSTPGCNFATNFTYRDIVQCMGLPRSCTVDIKANPCLLGTLAYLPKDGANFGCSDIRTTPVACVQGTSCDCGQIAIWDNQLGQTICRSLNCADNG